METQNITPEKNNRWLKIITFVSVAATLVLLAGAAFFYLGKKNGLEEAKKMEAAKTATDGENLQEGKASAKDAASPQNPEDLENPALSADQKAGDPDEELAIGDCGEDCNTDNWKEYKNKKYGYSFKYPPGFVFSTSCKNTSCVAEEEGGDNVFLQGDSSNQGWPMIEVRHLQNDYYNPPAGTNTVEWLRKKFSWLEDKVPDEPNLYLTYGEGHLFGAFDIFSAQSPQAYSRREIYFMFGNKLFNIVLLDVTSPKAKQFYKIWLDNFDMTGGKS